MQAKYGETRTGSASESIAAKSQTVTVPIRIAAQFAHSYIWRMTAAVDPKRIRERVGLSQAEFAARYRLSRDTVRGWEAGRPLSAARASC